MKSKVTRSIFGSQFVATISMTLVLFLMGIVCLLLSTANDLSRYVKENLTLSLVLNEDIENSEILKLQKNLDIQTFVKSTQYITKEKAIESLTEELGENPVDFLGYNPLLASIEVKLYNNYANNDSIESVKAFMKRYPQIKEINYQKDLIQAVNDNANKISIVLLVFAAIMLFISFALINNTIRLSIHSNRFLINTMKLVGANNGFIRRPYVLNNVICGIIASILAIGLITLLLYYIQSDLQNILSINMHQPILFTFGVILILGIFLSLIGATIAINRYLRIKTNDLYYI
jgi:cell division transport system permease protein